MKANSGQISNDSTRKMKKKKMKPDLASCEDADSDLKNVKKGKLRNNPVSDGAGETCTLVAKKLKRKASPEQCAAYDPTLESIQIVPKKKKASPGKDEDFSVEEESNGIIAKKKKKGRMIAEGTAAPLVPEKEGISPKKKKKQKVIAGEPDAAAAPLAHEANEIAPKQKKKDKTIAEEPAPLVQETNDIAPNKKKKTKKTIAEPPAAAPHVLETSNVIPKKKKKEKIIAEEPAAKLVVETNKIMPKKKKEKFISEEPAATTLQLETNVFVPKRKKKEKAITEDPATAAPFVWETRDKIVKKKEKVIAEEPVAANLVHETNERVPKRKKKEIVIAEDPAAAPRVPDTSWITPKKKKAKIIAEETVTAELVPETNTIVPKQKKRKMMAEEPATSPNVPEPNEVGPKKKKKRTEETVSSLRVKETDLGLKVKKKRRAENSVLPPTKLESKEFVPKTKKECAMSDCVTDLNGKKKKSKLNKDPAPHRHNVTCIEGERKAHCVVDVAEPKKKTLSGAYDLSETSESQSAPDVSKPKKIKPPNKKVTFLSEHTIPSTDNGFAAPDADISVSKDVTDNNGLCHENNEAGSSGTSSNDSGKKSKRKQKHSLSRDPESTENDNNAESDCGPDRRCDGDGPLTDINAKEEKNVSLSHQEDSPRVKKIKVKKDDKTKKSIIWEANNKAEEVCDEGDDDNNKKATQLEDTNDDIVLVPDKEGNCDEIDIDPVRRKSLQEDIDWASGNTKAQRFGQWDSASFESSTRQTKFLKLMGALKKGNQVAFTPSAHQGIGNQALRKEEAVVLERNLEAEFDKALSWKRNSGMGFGFQPEQSKKFYIDKTISKSVKFE